MNTHGTPDMMVELDGILGDLLPACVVSNTPPTVPASGMTLSAFATRAYVRAGTFLTYVDQPAVTVSLTGGDGTYWLAVTDDTFSAFSGWTRRAGSHYMWRLSATRPADVDNLLVFSQLTVSGGNISAVSTPWGVAPPLALATADKVSLGGHAPTGVLDVQGSVVASDVGNAYFGVRVWPVAPSGASFAQGLRVEPATGAAVASAAFSGLEVSNPPAMSSVYGVHLNVSAGTERYNIAASGSAQNYFAGNVGIGNSAPSYPLDVTGNARVTGLLGLGTAPTSSGVTLYYNRVAHGIQIQPNADSGGHTVLFLNAAGAQVGAIYTSATATTYATTSDTRLKHAVQALAGALGTIQALRPVQFKWNSTGESDIGFLAHELMTVAPHAVTGLPDEVHPDGTIRPQQVDSSKLIPILTAALKELLAQVETLTTRIATLEEALGV